MYSVCMCACPIVFELVRMYWVYVFTFISITPQERYTNWIKIIKINIRSTVQKLHTEVSQVFNHMTAAIS